MVRGSWQAIVHGVARVGRNLATKWPPPPPLFMVFSRQEYWSGLAFPSTVDHVLSELSTMTHPSWVALHGVAHSFTELDKAVIHRTSAVSSLWHAGYFSWCMWDLVLWQGIEPGPLALGVQSLSHWTASEVSSIFFKMHICSFPRLRSNSLYCLFIPLIYTYKQKLTIFQYH